MGTTHIQPHNPHPHPTHPRTFFNTYADAATANTNRNKMKNPVSQLFAVTRSVECKMVRINLPCSVSKPLRITNAKHPLSGVRIRACLSPVCCNILVPPNNTCRLSRLMLRDCVSPGFSSGRGAFHCGVDSPVKIASSQMQVPASSTASAGTTMSSLLAPPVGRPMEMRSPGRRSSPARVVHLPKLCVWCCCFCCVVWFVFVFVFEGGCKKRGRHNIHIHAPINTHMHVLTYTHMAL